MGWIDGDPQPPIRPFDVVIRPAINGLIVFKLYEGFDKCEVTVVTNVDEAMKVADVMLDDIALKGTPDARA